MLRLQDGQLHQQNVWEAIWSSKLPPKIKVFAWKLCSRALAVGEELARRGMQVSLMCHQCNQLETLEHMLWECPWVKRVWELLLA